jgi:hypothetical protein
MPRVGFEPAIPVIERRNASAYLRPLGQWDQLHSSHAEGKIRIQWETAPGILDFEKTLDLDKREVLYFTWLCYTLEIS